MQQIVALRARERWGGLWRVQGAGHVWMILVLQLSALQQRPDFTETRFQAMLVTVVIVDRKATAKSTLPTGCTNSENIYDVWWLDFDLLDIIPPLGD